MERVEIINKLNVIFEDIIDKGTIMLSESTTSNDVDGWDSLTHIQLVVTIEKAFDLRFTSEEILSWRNIGEMVDCIIENSKNKQ